MIDEKLISFHHAYVNLTTQKNKLNTITSTISDIFQILSFRTFITMQLILSPIDYDSVIERRVKILFASNEPHRYN